MLTWLRRERTPQPAPIPFVHVMPGGGADLTAISEQAAVRCALSRICANCAQSQGFPLVFVGSQAELDAGVFARPAMHEVCARAAQARYRAAGVTGAEVLLATGSFTVDRPWHRDHHEQTRFRPGPRLWVRVLTDPA